MTEVTEANARFKIDHGDRWFKFHVYKRGLFGWWWQVYQTNYMDLAEKYVAEASPIPKYFS